jgi:hypothetical protein
MESSIIIYQSVDGKASIEVTLRDNTVWMTQKQIADLFGTQRPAITKHINNIFKTKELDEKSVCSILEHTAEDGKVYQTRHYNLDAILSIGYRVNSKNATEFRIWANNILKNYIIQGYSLNEKRLNEQVQQLEALKKTVGLLGNVLEVKDLTTDEASGLLKVLTDYTYALDVLDKYDHQTLTLEGIHSSSSFVATYEEAMNVVYSMKEKFGSGSLFGNEKDESFKSSIATIYQTFESADLYPSIEEKAANFIYLIVKNHSFSDGNKRIAALLFVWFLEKNGLLYRSNGSKRIADNALVALTLMIAESRPEEKDIMTKVVVNLINSYN